MTGANQQLKIRYGNVIGDHQVHMENEQVVIEQFHH